jgi:hypothetical protein
LGKTANRLFIHALWLLPHEPRMVLERKEKIQNFLPLLPLVIIEKIL